MDVQPPISTGVPPSHYQAYLNSPGWRTRRNRALANASYQCSKCPSRRSLEVHHLSYERLGLERDSDLEVLCVMCHRGEHLRNPEQTSLGVYLKIASAALKKEPFATVADLSDMIKTACAKLKIPQIDARINAAIAVMIGNRLQTEPKPYHPHKADPLDVSAGDAREILIRIQHGLGKQLIRQMPTVGHSPAEQRAHEARLREQVADEQRIAYRSDQQRQPLRDRLEAIFTESL